MDEPKCPKCGSVDVCWDGVAYLWLCLNQACLADWADCEPEEPEPEEFSVPIPGDPDYEGGAIDG